MYNTAYTRRSPLALIWRLHHRCPSARQATCIAILSIQALNWRNPRQLLVPRKRRNETFTPFRRAIIRNEILKSHRTRTEFRPKSSSSLCWTGSMHRAHEFRTPLDVDTENSTTNITRHLTLSVISDGLLAESSLCEITNQSFRLMFFAYRFSCGLLCSFAWHLSSCVGAIRGLIKRGRYLICPNADSRHTVGTDGKLSFRS
ncbi:hypothetical protein R3P38DRAFT_1944513 [Favolaschia claudopus]|uniref:Uncharacterized protein n=1 Tax=Favolaschia claudopus TaxID=2862362 RepID=A0AAW0A184_9AGAR